MMSFLSKLFPDSNLKRLEGVVFSINELEPEIKKMSSDELIAESNLLKSKVIESESDAVLKNETLIRAFALVREASSRTLGQRHFDVQLIGGAVLNDGKIAEMLTGEGKTLTATSAVYFNALSGKGAHVVTVNDYLAKRDAVWMGQIYNALGLSVSCIVHDSAYIYDPKFESEALDKERDEVGGFRIVEKFLRPISRREAYACDITYGTNHEFGFDFLRDNLTLNLSERVQREPHFAIIDEVDSILIDEARTPLIIASPDEESSEYYKTFAKIVARMIPEEDYIADEKLRTVSATDAGIEKAEKTLNIDNLFSPENARLVHYLNESLKAKALFQKDKQYLIKNDEVLIVDEFTGRVLQGRRYSGGLHQAIEAKEGVFVKKENRTYAQITIQNYFRLYKKISGMTGTAQTSAEEFHKVYGLDVVSIPANRPLVRKDLSDLIYKSKEAKYRAIAEDVKERHKLGQPVLIGTTSIANNEIISEYLAGQHIPHEVLNAKNNEREGSIIAQAGRVGAVTVATNMAGRGVDILLGGNPRNDEEAKKILDLGGLHVIGTERHEARRIDNQLRGRAGRQGDPGSSRFFLSMEDDLMRIFGGDRMKNLMQMVNLPDDVPIESKMVSRSVNQAQQKVEGNNFDARKHLLDFDDVLNKQRSAIYNKRTKYLQMGESGEILPLVHEVLEHFVEMYERQHKAGIYSAEGSKLVEEAKSKLVLIPETVEKERSIMLGQHLVRILDMLWVEHLENLESLRDTVNIRAYGQHEPLVEYRKEAFQLFQRLQMNFEQYAFNSVFSLFELDSNKIKVQEAVPNNVKPEEARELGRNDPCYCGSGKKYKHCHGK
ncbi:MAG: preprotein translocase subunit SecA [Candidatus Jorgensenbacteria bacterium]|nr:preprotein translocase subunit SecA [Candidatus Jorgensenbacteria bacterium]